MRPKRKIEYNMTFLISDTTTYHNLSTLGSSLWHDIISVPGCLFKEALDNQHVRQYRKQQPTTKQWESETLASQMPWFYVGYRSQVGGFNILESRWPPFFDVFFVGFINGEGSGRPKPQAPFTWTLPGPAATSVPILGFQRSLHQIPVNGWKME